jgi:hypothetical protein
MVTHLTNKLLVTYWTWKFFAMFTAVRRRTVSWASFIHSTSLYPMLFLQDPFYYYRPFYAWSLKCAFLFRFPHLKRSVSPIRATCPAHIILPDFINPIIFGEKYKYELLVIHTKTNFLLTDCTSTVTSLLKNSPAWYKIQLRTFSVLLYAKRLLVNKCN